MQGRGRKGGGACDKESVPVRQSGKTKPNIEMESLKGQIRSRVPDKGKGNSEGLWVS